MASDPDRREHQTVTRGRNSRGAAAKVVDQSRQNNKNARRGHLPGLIALFKLDLSVGVVSKLF